MLATIKKQFKLDFADWVGVMLMVVLGAAILGQIIMALIVRFDSDVTRHVPVGTIMAILMTIIFVGIMMLANIRIQFHMRVSMGCTRKRFFVAYYVFTVAVSLIGWLMILAVGHIENILNSMVYSELECELYLVPYLWKWGVPMAVAAPIIAGFCGVLVMKFGRIAAGILWVFWMFLCLGGPNLNEAVENAPNSFFGRIGSGMMNVAMDIPGNVWIGLAVLFCLFCLAASYMMLRKLEVQA